MSGATSYHGGLAAEDQVARHYAANGYDIAAKRWRGTGGEIDLIARLGAIVICIEVKKSRSFANAAASLSKTQMARIYATASEFIATEPAGQLTEVRFDLAMLDDAGRIEVIENAFGL